MKPNFALNLGYDGISLLHRATGGWRIVGEISLNDPEMAQKITFLRRTATELAGGQFATKLVIPNSQILFRDIVAPGDTPGARRVAIRRALDGTTPYALDDLVFDWSDAGNDLAKVAVVASVTLEEAEAFGVEHRLNPVSFVANPEPGDFMGEPWFGTSRLAKGLLTSGETVERDDSPIVIVGRVPIADGAQSDAPEPQAAATPELTEPEIVTAPDLTEPEIVTAPDLPKPPVVVAPEEPGQIVGQTTEVIPPDPAEVPVEVARAAPAVLPDPADGDLLALEPDLDQRVPEVTFKSANPAKPEPATVAFASAFSTRRPPAEQGETKAGSSNETSPLGLEKIKPRIALRADKTDPEGPIELPKLGVANRHAEVTHLSVTAPELADDDRGADLPILTKNARAGAKSTVSAKPVVPPPSPTKKPITDMPPVRVAKAKELTVFGARKTGKVGGKPRYLGLVLMLALVVALAAAALLSNLILGEASIVSRLFQPTAPLATLTPATVAPDTDDPPTLNALDGAIDQIAVPSTDFPASVPQEMTPQDAEAIYEDVGIWTLDPTAPIDPDSDHIDDLYIASIDPVVIGHDAVALPDTKDALADAPPEAVQSPVPAGTAFDMGDDGLVRATPDGALTPNGVTVFAGKPPLVPAPRPGGTIAPEATLSNELAGFRPRARPGNLAEANEKSRLGGRTLSQLSALRPQPRPASAQEDRASSDAPATELAVLKSPAPASRPTDFSRIVEKAVAEAQASASSAPEATTVVASASATVAAPKLPSVPTRASVAKEATVANAINLGKINLIGVYGSSANRRALIRLSSGRYVKVQVGDRVDGGQVAAISATEVLYIKRGRKVTLAMPKG